MRVYVSGLREIIEWVQREVILNPENSVDVEFERISRMFEKDNRLPLADILRDDTPEFLEFLESELPGIRAKSKTDEEIKGPEQRASELESRISDIQQSISEGVEAVIKEPISIIGRVTNFIRGLFR